MGLSAITHKHLLLCEGMHDVEFFYHLAREHNLPDFLATSCGFVAGSPRGRDGITYLTPALNALPALPTFSSMLKKILIVADNDGNPAGALQAVQNQINATADIQPGRRYLAPAAPQVAAGVNPEVTILMLPDTGQTGALDTLCLMAAANKRPAVANCVDNFANCIAPVGWTPPREDKMRLRALLSASCPDPYIAPAWVWRDGTDLVPLDDAIFNPIVAFLRNYLI